MVGILGNLACHSEILNSIASDDELVSLVLGLLSNTDSPTVIQCVRLLDILLRATEKGKISTLARSYEIWKDLSFILKNSLNGIKDLFKTVGCIAQMPRNVFVGLFSSVCRRAVVWYF